MGGGQLAKMLYEAALPLGLFPTIFSETERDSAAKASPHRVIGELGDEKKLEQFLQLVDLVIFENEFVNCSLLRLLLPRYSKVTFQPNLSALEALRDKAEQKETLSRLAIPTSPFVLLPKGHAISEWLRAVNIRFPKGFVLKLGRMGYDGKGLLFVEDPSRDFQRAEAFCIEAMRRGISCYAEEKIAFKRELAMVACRSLHGEFVAYPLVVSEQRDGVCVRVLGPASAIGVTFAAERNAILAAQRLAEATHLTGTFAIEWFETAEGEWLVNEIAPRVHNSGHYTQNATVTSQFENHWRAVLGLPLGQVESAPAFVMENLLGPPGIVLRDQQISLPIPSSRIHLHWYAKQEIRPGRKIGHLNAVGRKSSELAALVAEVEECKLAWLSRMGVGCESKKR